MEIEYEDLSQPHHPLVKVDTKNLPDGRALVVEKAEEFRQFCIKYKIPFYLDMFESEKNGGEHIITSLVHPVDSKIEVCNLILDTFCEWFESMAPGFTLVALTLEDAQELEDDEEQNFWKDENDLT
jgi:hypothetical protein